MEVRIKKYPPTLRAQSEFEPFTQNALSDKYETKLINRMGVEREARNPFRRNCLAKNTKQNKGDKVTTDTNRNTHPYF